MIKLSFMINREIMNFRIHNKDIFYTDRYFIKEIRCIPKDEEFIKKITFSRGRFPNRLIQMFALSDKQQKEYDNAKDENELAVIIKNDCKKKGLTCIKEEKIDGIV